jgi:hypothetical protein
MDVEGKADHDRTFMCEPQGRRSIRRELGEQSRAEGHRNGIEEGPVKEERLLPIQQIMAGLNGIAGVCPVGPEVLDRVVAQEARYEKGSFIPLSNLGVREVRARDAALALLKDNHFREPPGPTVYLVEETGESNAPVGAHLLEVGERRFRILGEEVLASSQPYQEKTLFLADSFVLFPERRAAPRVPSFFLMPPLGFPELEQCQAELGIRRVISVSPSALSDQLLREACAFPADTALATLLVGFDRAAGATRGRAPNDPGSRAKP